MNMTEILDTLNGAKVRLSCGPLCADGVLMVGNMTKGGIYCTFDSRDQQVAQCTFHINSVRSITIETWANSATDDTPPCVTIELRDQPWTAPHENRGS